MTEPIAFTQYSDVTQLITSGGFPNWVPDYEKDRIAAYQAYEEMYWSHTGTLAELTRGTDDEPIYVPTARIIVNTLARYAGKGLRILPNPSYGSDAEKAKLTEILDPLLSREAFLARFAGSKKMTLIQGDGVWHVIGDPNRLPGARLQLKRIDPAAYFPVPEEYLEEDVYKRVHIAEQYVDPNDDSKLLVTRLTYTQFFTPDGGPGVIFSEEAIFEQDGWAGTGSEPPVLIEVTSEEEALDPRITTIPVYHFRNSMLDDDAFGDSVVRGLARIMAAINQSTSDEDVALALEGLGVYTTESGGPVDEDGEETEWFIAPGRVVENVKNFKRVQGVSSVQPFGDHIDRLTRFLFLAADVTDAAMGNIDAQTAESGIARMLKLAPTLEAAREINDAWKATLSQLFYDLNAWFDVYEGLSWGAAIPLISLQDPAPVDRAAAIEEILKLTTSTPPLMSQETALLRLGELGVSLAPDELAKLATQAAATPSADPYADRVGSEV